MPAAAAARLASGGRTRPAAASRGSWGGARTALLAGPPAVATLPAWVRRARNAHYNNLESLGLYASGVAMAIMAGVNPVLIGRLATQYIWSRAVYNVVYIAGEERIKTRGYLRSVIFLAGCVPPPVRLWLEAAAAATM